MIPAKETVNVYRGSTNNLFFTFSSPDDTPYDLSHFEKAEIAIFKNSSDDVPLDVYVADINSNSVSIRFTPAESLRLFRKGCPKIEVRFYVDQVNFLVYFIGDIHVLTPHNLDAESTSNNFIVEEGNTIINIGIPNDNNLLATAISARNEIVTMRDEIVNIKNDIDIASYIVSEEVHTIIKLSQAEYDALSPPDENTLYIIT